LDPIVISNTVLDRSVNTQNSCSPRCKLISQKKNLEEFKLSRPRVIERGFPASANASFSVSCCRPPLYPCKSHFSIISSSIPLLLWLLRFNPTSFCTLAKSPTLVGTTQLTTTTTGSHHRHLSATICQNSRLLLTFGHHSYYQSASWFVLFNLNLSHNAGTQAYSPFHFAPIPLW
jgi:hypothetical protein